MISGDNRRSVIRLKNILLFAFCILQPLALVSATVPLHKWLDKIIFFYEVRSDSLRDMLALHKNKVESYDYPIDSLAFGFGLAMLDYSNGERNIAFKKLNQVLELSIRQKNALLESRTRLYIAKILREEKKYLPAESQLAGITLTPIGNHDSLFYGWLNFEKGRLSFDVGKNTLALHHYDEAKSYWRNKNEWSFLSGIDLAIASSYLRLGVLFNHINPDKAKVFFQETSRYCSYALDKLESDDHLRSRCHALLLLIKAKIGLELFEEVEYLLNSGQDCLGISDHQIMLQMNVVLALIDEKNGNISDGIIRLRQNMLLKYKVLSPVDYYNLLFELSRLLQLNGEKDTALRLASESAEWFVGRGNSLQAYEAFHQLADWYEKDGRIEEALAANKKMDGLKNLLLNEADIEVYDELRYKYQTDDLRKQLVKAEKGKQLRQRQLISVLIIASVMALLFILIMVLLTLKRKKAILLKILAEERVLKSLEEAKSKELELQQVHLAHELLQQKALANQLIAEKSEQEVLLHALRRAEVINMQKEMFMRLLPFTTKFGRKRDRDAFEHLLDDFMHEAKDDPMVQFEIVFKQSYGDFYARLIEKAPDLSRSEIQIAVLLRLNLTSKEIAQVLSLNINTIERTRHQLRQKLNLSPGQQLIAALIGMG